jgi:hypothetical protein
MVSNTHIVSGEPTLEFGLNLENLPALGSNDALRLHQVTEVVDRHRAVGRRVGEAESEHLTRRAQLPVDAATTTYIAVDRHRDASQSDELSRLLVEVSRDDGEALVQAASAFLGDEDISLLTGAALATVRAWQASPGYVLDRDADEPDRGVEQAKPQSGPGCRRR